jgi:hypothetical protein
MTFSREYRSLLVKFKSPFCHNVNYFFPPNCLNRDLYSVELLPLFIKNAIPAKLSPRPWLSAPLPTELAGHKELWTGLGSSLSSFQSRYSEKRGGRDGIAHSVIPGVQTPEIGKRCQTPDSTYLKSSWDLSYTST